MISMSFICFRSSNFVVRIRLIFVYMFVCILFVLLVIFLSFLILRL